MKDVPRTFVGFGFGAIQAGLMLYEACRSKNFERLVVSEIQPELVDSLRRHGSYAVNIAEEEEIRQEEVGPIEALNPLDEDDRLVLVSRIAEAAELATALPSVTIFDLGTHSVAALLAAGLVKRFESGSTLRSVVYTSENDNHAAEKLEAAILAHLPAQHHGAYREQIQCLNTVIGKMSGIVSGQDEINKREVAPITPDSERAFVVEAFNSISVTQIDFRDFERGITIFEEKPDLLPFEEAKLYGHNASHYLLALLAHDLGMTTMAELREQPEAIAFARRAFLQEAGAGLTLKHGGLDPLFSPEGLAHYCDDLLERMTNPHLSDLVSRVIRDPRRKLAWQDRLIGAMRLSLQGGVPPFRLARGVLSAVRTIDVPVPSVTHILQRLWRGIAEDAPGEKSRVCQLVTACQEVRAL